jgi:hypothetical protein
MESLDVRLKLVVDTFQFGGAGRLFVEILLDRGELLQSAMVIFALPVGYIEQGSTRSVRRLSDNKFL